MIEAWALVILMKGFIVMDNTDYPTQGTCGAALSYVASTSRTIKRSDMRCVKVRRTRV